VQQPLHKTTVEPPQQVETSPAPSAEPTGNKSAPVKTDALPEDLKTAAYDYYGLQVQRVPMQLRKPGGSASGSEEIALEGVTKDAAKYKIIYKGSLDQLGTTMVELRRDGIYAVEAAGKPITPPQLELPTDIKPGKTWSIDGTSYLPTGEQVEQHTTVKIVGFEKIRIGSKVYDSLLVRESGTIKVAGNATKMTTNRWFVKGKGAVRMEIKGSDTKGVDSNATLEVLEP
jgi:hypothetical protein